MYISVRPGAGWNESFQASRHISEIKVKFSWDRKAHNVTESLIFLNINNTILLPTRIPNLTAKHRVLAISFEAVTSGGTRVRGRGLMDRNLFTRRLVWHTANVRLQTVIIQMDLLLQTVGHISKVVIMYHLSDLLNNALNSATL